ncbi:Kelch repeat-containing protein [Hymenobacter elongatus]|uniref:T9SS type A sorting domain-containing protein n=1 Tax=Hymenobacter elongatus TaxID=877208 RepID=A0A4Z0PI70_9BACT|nr:kelch repeat-containing protein [Hymenobacter elongatus]TGE14746.1 T9SS type A sorting domain-containing protein [Hymenobacter elongatus]
MRKILPALALIVLAAPAYQSAFAQQNTSRQLVPGQYYPGLTSNMPAMRAISRRAADGSVAPSRTTAAWTAVASMSLARSQHAATATGGKLYVWGGYIGDLNSAPALNSSLEIYNPTTNSWSAGANNPSAVRGHASAVGTDELVYSFSGVDINGFTSSCYRYNPTTNVWAPLAAIPVAVWLAGAATGADGRIYVFGGYDAGGNLSYTGTQIYTPATNTWSTGAPMPVGRHGHVAVKDASGTMHIIGGTQSSNAGATAITSHVAYNPTTNTWTTLAPLPVGVNQAGATLGADGNIYVVGGKDNYFNNNPTFFNTVYVYNPTANTWSTGTSLPILLSETKTVTLGTDLYTLAGANGVQQTVAYRSPVVGNFTWTGNISTSWTLGSNWSGGVVPTAADDVTITTGLTRYPVVTGTTPTARTITIKNGGQLTISNGGSLTVTGDFVNNGTFTAVDNASVVLTGATTQTVGGTTITQFRNLTVGGAGATLGGQVEIQRLLTLTGNLNTNSQRFLILSNNVGTAMVYNNGGIVTGATVVQRYIDVASNSGFGYRHFSPAVGGATLNNLAIFPVLPGAQNPGPMQINATYNSAAAPGAVTPFPTVFAYDQTRVGTVAGSSSFDQGWASPAAANQSLTLSRGLTINQPAGNFFELTGPTLITGAVAVGGLTRSTEADAGWQLIGNPYPSPIDWNRVSRTNVDAAAYVYRSTGQYDGGYTAYVNGVGTNILPMGQAFFVRVSTAGASGSVAFANASRETTFSDPTYARPAQTETRPLLQLTLQRAGATGAANQDDFYVYEENGATPGFDSQYDALKVQLNGGDQPTLYQSVGTEGLAIQGLPAGATPRSLALGVHVAVAGTYTFAPAQLLNFAATEPVWLEDKLSGQWHDLRQGAYTVPLGAGLSTTRFVLHLHQATVLAGGKAAAWTGELQLYPNPAASKAPVTVVASGVTGQAELVLVNSVGQRVWQQTATAAGRELRASVPTTGLAAGIYTLQVRSAAGVLTRKLVVQ